MWLRSDHEMQLQVMRIPFGPQGAQKWELQAERLIPNSRMGFRVLILLGNVAFRFGGFSKVYMASN